MSDERGGNGRDHGGDAGRPIEELAGLLVPPRRGFLGGIRRRIQRRMLGTQVMDLGWFGTANVLWEFLKMIFESFGGKDREREES